MLTKVNSMLIRFGFYLAASFTAATCGYFIIQAIRPNQEVFGSAYRMLAYHLQHPLAYIFIPCAVYSLIITVGGSKAAYKNVFRQITLTGAIIFFSLLLSFPLGGILYYYHDMQAGYFPDNWPLKLLEEGTAAGFQNGWLIIALSFPYNLLGIVICYYITKAGNRIFHKKAAKPAV